MIAKSLDSDALLVTIELLDGNVLHHRHRLRIHIPDRCLPDLDFVLPDFGNLPLPLFRLPVIVNQTIDVGKRK